MNNDKLINFKNSVLMSEIPDYLQKSLETIYSEIKIYTPTDYEDNAKLHIISNKELVILFSIVEERIIRENEIDQLLLECMGTLTTYLHNKNKCFNGDIIFNIDTKKSYYIYYNIEYLMPSNFEIPYDKFPILDYPFYYWDTKEINEIFPTGIKRKIPLEYGKIIKASINLEEEEIYTNQEKSCYCIMDYVGIRYTIITFGSNSFDHAILSDLKVDKSKGIFTGTKQNNKNIFYRII